MVRLLALIVGSLSFALFTYSSPAEQPFPPLHVLIAHGPGTGDLHRFQEVLEGAYHVKVSWLVADKARKAKGASQFTPTPFEGLGSLKDCDVILSNLYRTWAVPEQLNKLKMAFLNKPVVGLRKAHHGFQNWLEADREVFGMQYRGHYGKKNKRMVVLKEQKDHPLIRGHTPFVPAGGLYRHEKPFEDVTVLMVGGGEGDKLLPQTWFRVNGKSGQRVFYTRYDPRDLRDKGAQDHVIRALFWAAGKERSRYKK